LTSEHAKASMRKPNEKFTGKFICFISLECRADSYGPFSSPAA
jgi:hypothetical protein